MNSLSSSGYHQPPMRRPGPLQELPLEHFLPPNPNIPKSSARPSKRPLSPGVSKLLSPAKRRVLNEEGLLPIENPSNPPSRTPRQSSFGRFSDVLNGPGSPAKVLDFGPSKNHLTSMDQEAPNVLSTMPRRPVTRSMTKLAPPPELIPSQGASRHSKESPDNMFESRRSSSGRSPLYVPRDLPPSLDPQSIHYPGFEIHRDPYIVIFPPMDTSEQESLKDDAKENVPCRRKSRKASDKVETHPQVTSQEPANDYGSNKLSSPKKIFSMCANMATPSRRLGIGSLPVDVCTSNSRSEECHRKVGKMKMMEEVDEVSCDSEDEDEERHELH